MWKPQYPGAKADDVIESPSHEPAGARMGVVNLGRSVGIKGDLTAAEDLMIDGHFEGRIELTNHALTIGPNASMTADVSATVILIFGSLVGTATARDKLEIRRTASVRGDLAGPRVIIQEGAQFSGNLTTRRS